MVERFFKYLLKNQVILALFLIVLGWIVLQIKSILISLFISYIIMAALTPTVSFFKKRGLPKLLSVSIPFIGTFLLLSILIIMIVPFFIDQLESLLKGLPVYLKESANIVGFDINKGQVQAFISREINTLSSNAITLTGRVFGGVFSTLTILIVSFYLLYDREAILHSFTKLFDKPSRPKVHEVVEQIDDKLGAWVRGQIILCLFIGGITWMVLSIIHFPYAVPLAIIAGILEAVPTLGPILSAIPAVIVAFTISTPAALTIAGIYALIQMLENNILVPKIMQRAVGLHPVVVILVVTIGGVLMGIAGALLSIPFSSLIILLFNALNTSDDD